MKQSGIRKIIALCVLLTSTLVLYTKSTPIVNSPAVVANTTTCNGNVKVCSLPATKAAFVGTHNSGAFNLELSNEASSFLDISCFADSQTNNYTKQLVDGVRWLNVDAVGRDGVIYNAHSQFALGGPLGDSIKEVFQFLQANRREFVVFQLSDTENISMTQFNTLIKTTCTEVGQCGLIVEPNSWLNTIGDNINAGKRVIFVSQHGSETLDLTGGYKHVNWLSQVYNDNANGGGPQTYRDFVKNIIATENSRTASFGYEATKPSMTSVASFFSGGTQCIEDASKEFTTQFLKETADQVYQLLAQHKRTYNINYILVDYYQNNLEGIKYFVDKMNDWNSSILL